MSETFSEAFLQCSNGDRERWAEALRARLDGEIRPLSPSSDEIVAARGEEARRRRRVASAQAIGRSRSPGAAAARLLWWTEEMEDESEEGAVAARDFRTGIVWWLAEYTRRGMYEETREIGRFLQDVEGLEVDRWRSSLLEVACDVSGDSTPYLDSGLELLARSLLSVSKEERENGMEQLLEELGVEDIDVREARQRLVAGTVVELRSWFEASSLRDIPAGELLAATPRKTAPGDVSRLPLLQVVPRAWSQELGSAGPVDVWLARVDDELYVRVLTAEGIELSDPMELARPGAEEGSFMLVTVEDPKGLFLVPELATGHWFHAGRLDQALFEAFSGTGWVIRTARHALQFPDWPVGSPTENERACLEALKYAEHGRWYTFLMSLTELSAPPSFLLRIHVRYYLKYLLKRDSRVMAEARKKYLEPLLVERLSRLEWLGLDVIGELVRPGGAQG